MTELLFASWLLATPPADLVVTDAQVWTGVAAQPNATALAVRHGRLIAVGTDADVQTLMGPTTRHIRAAGARVVPGFNDAHVHLLGAGLLKSRVALKDVPDEAGFRTELRRFDQKLPRDRWLLGGNWDHERALAGKLPSAVWLDQTVPNRPTLLRRYDGHMAVANTRALQLAGIDATTPDPPGGVIDRMADGKTPTGILKESAIGLVERIVPPPNDAEIAEAVQAALAEAARLGVTTLQDMDGFPLPVRRRLFRHYQHLDRTGRLTARIDFRWPLGEWRSWADQGIQAGFGSEWLTVGGLKGYADGSLGSSTAKLFTPYVGSTDNTGVYVTPVGTLREWVLDADAAGLAVCIHAIGDRSNADLLDIFTEANQRNGPRDRRFRIEHAQHLRPADIPRFAAQKVIASLQPYHIVDDGRWAESRLGAERCASSYANRALLDAGATLAFGSDWPVAPLDPLLGIDAAVQRRTLDGKHPNGWFPAQKIRVVEALTAYTAGSAYAMHQDHQRGRLAVGMQADFVLLSRDLLDPQQLEHLAQTRVRLTVVGGKVVYEAK